MIQALFTNYKNKETNKKKQTKKKQKRSKKEANKFKNHEPAVKM
jgi:hypothetical protein